MKRSELRRSGSLKRTRLAPVSRKQRARKQRWPAVKALVFERDRYQCQRCAATPITATLDVHHIKTVARGGDDEPENLITLCRFPCHEWVHTHVAEATAMGYLIPSWGPDV